MASINKPRGTYDLFGTELELFDYIENSLKMIANLYNTKQIITPIFEHKELFIRNIGENSDIVTKEFYDFKDKSDRELVLRPENTIGVIRAIIENKLINTLPFPQKYFYIGPMFRYERPQSGRNRQFYQFGVEYIGILDIYEQIDIIYFAQSILQYFGIKNYKLKINYIGSFETRSKWIESLKEYFLKFEDKLSEDSKKRLHKNPLRILDDKIDGKKDFVLSCPKASNFFNEQERKEWNNILSCLDFLKIDYEVDETLVRGLDYYIGFVFEFYSLSNKLTGQSTLIGGGKYCNLTKELGSNNYDCIGFGMGIERLMIAINDEKPFENKNEIDIYFLTHKLDSISKSISMILINTLRSSGFSVEMNFSIEKIDKQFKYATKFNPKVILIFGENEIKKKNIIIKEQISKTEKTIDLEEMINEIRQIIKK